MQCIPINELNINDVYYVRSKINWYPNKFIATYIGFIFGYGMKGYSFKYLIDGTFGYININAYGAVIRKKTNARKKYLIKILETILDKDFAIMNADYV